MVGFKLLKERIIINKVTEPRPVEPPRDIVVRSGGLAAAFMVLGAIVGYAVGNWYSETYGTPLYETLLVVGGSISFSLALLGYGIEEGIFNHRR